MAEVKIREAGPGDAGRATESLRSMLEEMAALGGHPLAEAGEVSDWLQVRFAAAIEDPDHLFLVAELEEPEAQQVGILEASVIRQHPVFEPRRMMHIHALYVEAGHRGRGVARLLVDAALQWGREHACVEASLSVLAGNPAHHLYERLGFCPFELELRRAL
jgi:GNAT superfamily N-acetyltransferase